MTSAELLSQKQAAEILGLSPKTLEKWRSLGTPRLAFVRLGSAVRYRMCDLDRFIEASVVGGEVQPKGRRKNRAG